MNAKFPLLIELLSAFAILKNREDAQDAAQDAILKAFAKLSIFRGESKFSTLLCRIVINESVVKLRTSRHHLQDSLDEPYRNENGDYVLRDFADRRVLPSKELESDECDCHTRCSAEQCFESITCADGESHNLIPPANSITSRIRKA